MPDAINLVVSRFWAVGSLRFGVFSFVTIDAVARVSLLSPSWSSSSEFYYVITDTAMTPLLGQFDLSFVCFRPTPFPSPA